MLELATAQGAKAERRQSHIEHLQALQAAAQPQNRTSTAAPPGPTVQLPTPGGTRQPATKSQRNRAQQERRIIRRLSQKPAAAPPQVPAPSVNGAAVAVPGETVAYDAVQGAVVSVDRITDGMWSQVKGLGNFVKQVNKMKHEAPTGDPNPTAARRPPEKWLQDTGARYDMIGRNELPNDPEVYTTEENMNKPLKIFTGNGLVTVRTELPIDSEALGEEVRPMLMDSSPAA